MSLMLILMLTVVVCVLVIKAKLDAIHRQIDDKLHQALNVIQVGEAIVEKVRGHKK